jgi:hypothetical protein
LDHEVFFKKQVALLNHPDNTHWRRFPYKELDAWYTDFKPTKKHKGRSVGRTSTVVAVDHDEIFIRSLSNLDNFDEDPWKDDAPPPSVRAACGVLACAPAISMGYSQLRAGASAYSPASLSAASINLLPSYTTH